MTPPPSEGPLLDVRGLTLRFRGLTAVNAVDLRVHEGEIAAVIGPNGAGKTSLFNAITGIYEPTEGEVHFAGKDLRAPLEPRLYVRWGLLGLAVAIGLYLFVADVDKMWAAVVKPNYRGPIEGFGFHDAWTDLGDYLAARPRIERRTGRYYLATFDGQTPFGSSRTREEALVRREAILEMARPGPTIAPDGDGFVVRSADGERVLDRGVTPKMLELRVAAAANLAASGAAAIRRRALALLVGFVIGAAGGFAIWRRTRRTPTSVAQRGIARTFQNIRLFHGMSVLENVLVALDQRATATAPSALGRARQLAAPVALVLGCLALALLARFEAPTEITTGVFLLLVGAFAAYVIGIAVRGGVDRAGVAREAAGATEARALLAGVGLGEKADELASSLAYGDQRRLEIARALATRPRLLLLDEPAAGMNPSETVGLMALIRTIRDDGVTVLLIEHHMRVVMGISDRIVVLQHGQTIAEGTPAEIRADAKVIEAYLGQQELG